MVRRFLGAFVLSLLGSSAAALAQTANRWDSVGPPPGHSFQLFSYSAIAVDPTDSSTLWAGTAIALYKSVNGGASWQQVFQDRIGSPINPLFRTVQWISIDPANPSTVFVGTGGGSVFRTRDGGDTWLTVVPAEGVASLHATSASGPVFACVTPSVGSALVTRRSTDSGTTWSEVAPLAGKAVLAFADDPASPGRVWAAVSQDPAGAAVYVSEDGGTTWAARAAGIVATRSTDLAIDPAEPDTLYLGTADGGVYETTDAGEGWAPANEGLVGTQVVTVATGSGSAVYAGTLGNGLFRSDDGGAHWAVAGFRDQEILDLAVDPMNGTTLYVAATYAILRITPGPVQPCAADGQTLCLQGSRYLVRASWRTDRDSGTGQAVGLTPDIGDFWFFEPNNVEVVLKVLDGGSVNGRDWVFYGALSNVEYTITVVDTVTGEIQSYFNMQSVLASVADTSAFPSDPAASAVPARPGRARSRPALVDACSPGPDALCLNGGRFRVDVSFTRTPSDAPAPAPAVPLTEDTGYFWFFDESNVELVVKVLDGRSVNGHFWVFYGALSNVEYEVTITDTRTGEQQNYVNERGNLASVADTSAF